MGLPLQLLSSNTEAAQINSEAPPQVDGPSDYHNHRNAATTMAKAISTIDPPVRLTQGHHQQSSRLPPHPSAHTSSPHQTLIPRNVVKDLLPYCTVEPPLSETQVIAVSDVAGSLKELALLALSAASGDIACLKKLQAAVGERTATNIIEFFADEWEIEG